jgi:immune inhibitor A
MVDAYPNLKRRFINTNGIVTADNSHLFPDLYSKHPEDYVSIQTHKTIERIKPWVEISSPIINMQRKYGFSGERQGQSLQPIVIDKILVLGVEFSDKPAQIPIETIYERFFGDYINSMKEYFKEVSYSRYIPNGEIHGWYRAPQSSDYYTDKQNGFGKYPMNAERLIEDVIDIASNDPDIDWASFDNNDNGYIDNLIVVHSGAEAAWTGDVNDFWAHVWIIPEPKIIQERYVWIYAITSEYLGKPEDPQVIGGDCHEHGHQ